MIWAKTLHSLDLPKPRQSTPSRSATNGEDDPRRNRWTPHGEWTDAQPMLSMSIGGPFFFGMADRRKSER